MKKVSILGIDLAKNTFQLHGADRRGGAIFSKKIKREKLLSVVEKLDKEDDFLIVMEACGGAHHVARSLMAGGYRAKLIAPQFVKPFVKSNKNDAKDAEAITEAAGRSNMRFVGVKSVEQQDIQAIHRVREGFIKRRTAIANEMRGLLLEYGLTVPQGIHRLKKLSGRSRELHPQPPSEPYMIVSHHTAPMTFTFPRYLPAVQVSLDSV